MSGVRVRWDQRNKCWYARKLLGTDVNGKRVYPRKSFPAARTEAEAQAMAETWERSLRPDGRVGGMRLADVLGEYIDMRERNGCSPNTARTWRALAKNHVAPALGRRRADELTAMDFNRLEQRLLTPEAEGGAGLSRNSVNAVHQMLSGLYEHLVKSGVCAANPLRSVAHPALERHEARYLDELDFGDAERALSAAVADGAAPWASRAMAFGAWLSLHTGLRVGEVCALRVSDVRRARGAVHVGGTVIEQAGREPWRRDVTKGRRCRNVSLDGADMRRVGVFMAMRRAEGVTGPWLVTADGSLTRPTALSSWFSATAKAQGWPVGTTFHTLRHTHATWCLAGGVDPKTLSERLGHADVATTLRVYAHVAEGRDMAASEAFARAAERAAGEVTSRSQPEAWGGGGEDVRNPWQMGESRA